MKEIIIKLGEREGWKNEGSGSGRGENITQN